MSPNPNPIYSDTDEQEILPEVLLLTRGEKIWLILIAAIFAATAVLAALGTIELSAEIISALILAAFFSSWFIIPKTVGFFRRYIKSVKIGDLEITLFEQQTDLSKRLKKLEDVVVGFQSPESAEVIQAEPDSQLITRFEAAARKFGGSMEQRILAVKEMTYYGVQLGVDYLETKLRGGSLGEQVGAATALGELAQPASLDSLLWALNHNSSFVRYRAARSIERLTPVLNPDQVEKAATALRKVVAYEANPHAEKAIRRAVSTLERKRAA